MHALLSHVYVYNLVKGTRKMKRLKKRQTLETPGLNDLIEMGHSFYSSRCH